MVPTGWIRFSAALGLQVVCTVLLLASIGRTVFHPTDLVAGGIAIVLCVVLFLWGARGLRHAYQDRSGDYAWTSLIRDIGLFSIAVIALIIVGGSVGFVVTLFPLWVQWLLIGISVINLILLLIFVLSRRGQRNLILAGRDIYIDEE
jgi:F0F1-type ATP synthase assembly protein I